MIVTRDSKHMGISSAERPQHRLATTTPDDLPTGVHRHSPAVGAAKGEHGRSIELAERGLVLARTWNIVEWVPTLHHTLGTSLRLSGRVDDAVVHGEQAVKDGRLAVYRVHLGDTYVAVGRIRDARQRAEEGIALAREQDDRRGEALAFRLFGDIAALSDPPNVASAEGYYQQALTVASELGLRPLMAHCHLSVARLYRRTGTREHAHEHLTTATTMYREMGMTYWLEKVEAEQKT